MTTSRAKQDRRRKAAYWMIDAFGPGGEINLKWIRLAEDFESYMADNGWAFKPIGEKEQMWRNMQSNRGMKSKDESSQNPTENSQTSC